MRWKEGRFPGQFLAKHNPIAKAMAERPYKRKTEPSVKKDYKRKAKHVKEDDNV